MRAHIFRSYADIIIDYLSIRYPLAKRSELETFVTSYIEEHCAHLKDNLEKALEYNEDLTVPRTGDKRLWPTIQLLEYTAQGTKEHSYGNIQVARQEELFKHITRLGDKIIAPFGSVYETTDKISSFLKGMIDEKSALRKKEKKLMLKAKQANDKIAATYHNNNQSTIKVNMNSLIGAMGSNYNFLSSIANFNSVTSTGRYFVTNAFAHGERFLHSNFYFKNEEQLINHILTCRKCGPDKEVVLETCKKIGFKIPSINEVYDFLIENLHNYQFKSEHPIIRQLLEDMHEGELTFLYYMSNMKHLVWDNEWYFRPWFDAVLNDTYVDFSNMEECNPEDLREIDGDLAVVLSTVYNPEMPVNDKGNSISIYDTVTEYPDLAKRFLCIGKYMQSKMDEFKEVFDLFMCHNVAITYVHELKHMFRDVIMLSDTDSILFTVKDWVEWYQKSMKFTPTAYSVNAIVVYWLSKSIKSLIANMSRAFGATGKDVFKMNMKNEFMMPIEIVTSLKKHYASILAIQEGVFYKTPKMDIKGVNLRGSNYSQETLDFVEWWIQDIINLIYDTGKLQVSQKIIDILRFERVIYDSLRKKETRFLTVDPVKNQNEYAEADRSIYFNYLFWEHVFSDKYNHILIPTKCFMLPLTNVKNPAYQAMLADRYPDIKRKMEEFINKYPTKDITRIPINPLTNVIPDELIPVMNYKSVIYDNVKPFYIILQSLGISLGNGKNKILFSDTYGWVSSEEADKCRIHLKKAE